MLNKKTISVVLPVLNTDVDTASRCIDSLIRQTFTDIEIIIVNESKNTEVNKKLREYSEADQRIRILLLENGKNLAYAINSGILLSSGEFIARMDIDDECLPDRFEKQLRFLFDYPEVAVVGSHTYIRQGSEDHNIRKFPLDHSSIKRALQFFNPICHPSVLMRKQVVSSVGLYDEKFFHAEDYELWCRLVSRGYRLANIDEPLLHYSLPASEVRAKENWLYNLKIKIAYFGKFSSKFSSIIGIGIVFFMYLAPPSVIIQLYKLRNLVRKQ